MKKINLKYIVLGSTFLQTVLLAIILVTQLSEPKYSGSAVDDTTLAGAPEFTPGSTPNQEPYASFHSQIESVVREVLKQETRHQRLDNVAHMENTATNNNSEPKLSDKQLAQQEHAAIESQSIVSQAILAGAWTQNDSELLSRHFQKLSELQRVEVLETLYGAINRREIDLIGIPVFQH